MWGSVDRQEQISPVKRSHERWGFITTTTSLFPCFLAQLKPISGHPSFSKTPSHKPMLNNTRSNRATQERLVALFSGSIFLNSHPHLKIEPSIVVIWLMSAAALLLGAVLHNPNGQIAIPISTAAICCLRVAEKSHQFSSWSRYFP